MTRLWAGTADEGFAVDFTVWLLDLHRHLGCAMPRESELTTAGSDDEEACEMKTCPHCKTQMIESDEPNQLGALPQWTQGEPLEDVHRVRYECPECHHLESALHCPER